MVEELRRVAARRVSQDLESQKAEARPGALETSGFSEEVVLAEESPAVEVVYPEPQTQLKAETTS